MKPRQTRPLVKLYKKIWGSHRSTRRAAMVRSGPSPNFRGEIRTIFEQSAGSLDLYEYLVSQRGNISENSSKAPSKGLENFKRELGRILSSMKGPYLGLETRLELICLLNRIPPNDEPEFIGTLLKLVALQLEPDLRAGESDVDRRAYLTPLLKRRNLERKIRDQLTAAHMSVSDEDPKDSIPQDDLKILKARRA